MGLKYVDRDFAKTIATGIPTTVIHKNKICKTVTIDAKIPSGKYSRNAITSIIFHINDFSLLATESETIFFEKGDRRNLECWIRPSPIGAPITVIVKKIPIKKV